MLRHYLHPELGYLRLSGPDRVDFLQRQTTNDVRLLSPTRGLTTVLTNPAARILDVLQLLDEGDTIGIIPLPGRSHTTFNYLRKRIFFNDNVELSNASAHTLLVDLEGDTAPGFLRQHGIEPPPLDGVTSGQLGGVTVRLLAQPGLFGTGYRLLTRAGEPLIEQLTRAGIPPLSPAEREILRVEAGLPAVDHELTETYTPHETNLDAWISETKGCYTGQEVLARQTTYDKVTRRMVGLRLEAPVEHGARVTAGGKPAGAVTSAVVSPRLGPIALAVLKRPHNQPGTAVQVASPSGDVPATVVPLPFSPSFRLHN